MRLVRHEFPRLACLALVGCVCGSTVEFSPPSTTGHATISKLDPVLLTLPSDNTSTAHVVATGALNNKPTLVESHDGGTTWMPSGVAFDWVYDVNCKNESATTAAVEGSSNSVMHAAPCVAGTVGGLSTGYLQNETDMSGPWTASYRHNYFVNTTDNTIADVLSTSAPLPHWAATPHSVGLLAFDSGGLTRVSGEQP